MGAYLSQPITDKETEDGKRQHTGRQSSSLVAVHVAGLLSIHPVAGFCLGPATYTTAVSRPKSHVTTCGAKFSSDIHSDSGMTPNTNSDR